MHDGRTYFYYGLVPAIARLPISAVTHALDGRLVLVSMLGGLVVGCLAAARLLQRARQALAVELPDRSWMWITGVFAAAVGLATPLLWLSSRALVYHEAELWGAALAILGFERVVAWWSSRRPLDLAWASGAAALAICTRGSSGSGPAMALGGLAVVLAVRRDWSFAARVAGAAVVPVVLFATVNQLRFGTPFRVPYDLQVLNEFSASRRAALADTGNTLFGLTSCRLRCCSTCGRTRSRCDRSRRGSRGAIAPMCSVTSRSTPSTAAHRFRSRRRRSSSPPSSVSSRPVRRRLPASWPIALAASIASVIPTVAIAFIAHRFLADFVPALVVGAALGVPIVAAWAGRVGPPPGGGDRGGRRARSWRPSS